MAGLADPSRAFRLDGRVALVTGASSGIGERFARVLSAAGASVVVAARRASRLEALAADLGASVLPVPCDLASPAEVEALAAAALDWQGRVDVLVNNAGLTTPVPAEDETPEAFRYVMEVNLNAVYRLTQLIARPMLERGDGAIVNVASVLGIVGSGQIPQAAYAASKGAVVNLTRELGAQWARRGVRVNAIAPGWFGTEMTGEMFAEESGVTWVKRRTPIGRVGELEELDGALLFLASDASRYVIGQTIAVDGGFTAI